MTLATRVVFAFVAIIALAGSPGLMAGDGRNVSSVNGDVNTSAGETYGSVSTVNGGVHIVSGVTADRAKTVNGEIEVENNAKIGELSTVNGSVDIGDDVAVERNASTVNGGIEVGKRSRVGGNVSTVNGEIEIGGGEVAGQVITTKGKNLPTNLVGGDFLVIRNGLVLRLRNLAAETQQEHTRDYHEKSFSHNHSPICC